MIAVPETMPDTTPVDISTTATVGLLLAQVPPASASANVVVLPWHTVNTPVIGAGLVVIVTI